MSGPPGLHIKILTKGIHSFIRTWPPAGSSLRGSWQRLSSRGARGATHLPRRLEALDSPQHGIKLVSPSLHNEFETSINKQNKEWALNVVHLFPPNHSLPSFLPLSPSFPMPPKPKNPHSTPHSILADVTSPLGTCQLRLCRLLPFLHFSAVYSAQGLPWLA